MSAAMEAAASTVEATASAVEASAMEVATTTVEASASAMEATAYVATTSAPATAISMPSTVISTPSAAISTPSAAVISPATTVSPSVVVISSPTPAVPGAGAKEDAVIEPLRAIVAIGCTGIGRVAVVAILTFGRNVRITAADINSKRDLRVRRGGRCHEESKECKEREISETTHGGAPLLALPERHVVFQRGPLDVDAYLRIRFL